MSKKKSKKVAKSEAAKKDAAEQKSAEGESAAPAAKYIIRAIRVTQEMLDAAKAYKKASGVSFYRLGEECITARLVKEGYLKEPAGTGK